MYSHMLNLFDNKTISMLDSWILLMYNFLLVWIKCIKYTSDTYPTIISEYHPYNLYILAFIKTTTICTWGQLLDNY